MNQRIIRILIGLVIIVAVVGSVVYWRWPEAGPIVGPPTAEAEPTITWMPASIEGEVGRGEIKSVRVTFKAAENASDVVVRVVSGLQSLVSVNPSALPSIQNGLTYTIVVTFSASDTTPVGTFDGTIQLRTGSTLARPLPVILLVTVVPLPPDPGEAGKATVEGFDSDRDGVRDDVQRYIGLAYPSSARARATLTQYVKALQEIVVAGGHGARVSGIASHWTRAIDCAAALYGEVEAKRLLDAARARLLNTRDRSIAYIRANQELSGESFPVDVGGNPSLVCDFEVATLSD